MGDRPTAADKADAAERFIEALDEATAAIWKAAGVLRERRERGASSSSFPLFFWGERLRQSLDKAAESLHAAHREAAVQAFDERRKAAKADA